MAADLQQLVMETRREYENSIYDGPDERGVHGDLRTGKQNLAATLRALVQVDSFQSVMANSRALFLPPMHANLPCTMGLINAVQPPMDRYSQCTCLTARVSRTVEART